MVEGRAVNSNMDGFSGNLFAVLVCYLEVGDVGSGVVVRNAVFINITADMMLPNKSVHRLHASYIVYFLGQFILGNAIICVLLLYFPKNS